MIAFALLGALGLAQAGCDGTTTATRPCDPLARVTLPITLGQVVGVGRDANGTVYLVDEVPGFADRLFISQGTALARQPAGGSGTSPDGARTLTVVTSGDPTSPLNVEVESEGGHATAMGLFRGPLATKTFDIATMGEALQVLTTDALSAYVLQNLPGTFSIQHLATLADARELVVVVPDVDDTGSDTRIFFGAPGALAQRRVTPTTQPKSYTLLRFDLDGQEAVVTFASPFNPSIATELTVNGQTFPLTEAPAGPTPNGTTFLCF